MGLWESGDAIAVIPENSPMYEIVQFDRVVMLNSTDTISRVLTRGAVTERLLVSVEAFTREFWLATDGALLEGGLPVVCDYGELSWPNGREPPGGTQSVLNCPRFPAHPQ